MSEALGNHKEILKDLIMRLHSGEDPQIIKREFQKVFQDVTPVDISEIESELVKEGMSRDEIQKLCDVHLSVLKESFKTGQPDVSEGHPVKILMKEHDILLKYTQDIRELAKMFKDADEEGLIGEELNHVEMIKENLQDSNNHYLREENILFPYLEKHGVTEPPAVMWMEHDKIRELKKHLYKIIENSEHMIIKDYGRHLEDAAIALSEMLSGHFYKENNVIFPTALKVIKSVEWREIRKQFDEIGYCCFTPEVMDIDFGVEDYKEPAGMLKDKIAFQTGELLPGEIEAVFNTLPVDVTFIDKDDTVRYFSRTKERIFVRTKAIIGRKVQQCHPEKSLHFVNRILEDFKNDERESAEFWLPFEEKYVYIRYFPVRDGEGNYLGCLEVTQDISAIQKIEGEKRLL